MKRLITILLLAISGFVSAQTYQLNYPDIRIGNSNTGKIVLRGSNVQFPFLALGSTTDSVVTIVGGVFKKVPRSQFSGGGGSVPIGTDKQVLGYSSGTPTVVDLGLTQLSDVSGIPAFSNGLYAFTGINPTTGSAFRSFIEFSTTTPKAGTFPSYGTGGVLPVNNGVDSGDAVNLGQLNSAISAYTPPSQVQNSLSPNSTTLAPSVIAVNTALSGYQPSIGYSPNELTGRYFNGYKEIDDPETSANTEPHLVRMANGNILMVYRKSTTFEHVGNDGYLAGKISTDEGVNWGAEFTVFNDTYDDRNHIVAKMPNNDIVVVFRRFNQPTGVNIDMGYVRSTDNGATWGSYNIIENSGTVTLSIPFGNIVTRGTDIYFPVQTTNSGVNTFRLYKSTNNLTSTTFTNMVGTITNNAVEPFLIDIGGGKSIMLARNNNIDVAGQKSFYQYNSSDGVNFTYKGITNIWGDKNYSVGTPVSMYWDSVTDDLIVVTTERQNPNTMQPNQVYNMLRIYNQKAESVYTSQTAYSLKHDIPRPKASDYRFYGYPSILTSNTGLLAVLSDASAYNRAISTSEDADIYSFRLDPQSTIKELINTPILDSKVVVNNGYTGLKDYVDYNTISKVSATRDKQDILINNVTGNGVDGRASFWTGTNTLGSDDSFFWDNSNKRLGIGNNIPLRPLDVNGIIRSTNPGNPGFELNSTISDTDNRNWDIRTNVSAFGDFDIRRSTSQGGIASASALNIKNNGDVLIGGKVTVNTAPSGSNDVVRKTELDTKQNLVSLTTTGSGAATFNQSTGALNIPTPSGGGAVTSLTTTGTSGDATLSSGVLNIPNYVATDFYPLETEFEGQGLSSDKFRLKAAGVSVAKGGTGVGTLTGIPKGNGTSPFTVAVASDFPTLNQNTTGSAATLTTARTINGVSFNGSANINITSPTLTTTRTIWGQNFNGSANVTGALTGVTTITASGDISGGNVVSSNAAGNPTLRLNSTNADAANRNWDWISNLTAFGKFNLRRSATYGAAPSISVLEFDGATGNANFAGNISAANLASDVYTPSAFVVSNVTSVTANQHTYTRVGNIVTFSGSITATPSGAGSCTAEINKPILSTFISSRDANGSVSGVGVVAGVNYLSANSSSGGISIKFSVSGGGTPLDIYYTGQYVIK